MNCNKTLICCKWRTYNFFQMSQNILSEVSNLSTMGATINFVTIKKIFSLEKMCRILNWVCKICEILGPIRNTNISSIGQN